VLRPENPTQEEIRHFQYEHEITRSIDTDGIISILGLQESRNTLIIIEEDIAAESLDKWIKHRRLTLEECLFLAVRISECIRQIHAAKVIHKDLNPSNILWNSQIDLVKIIDFGFADRMPSEAFAFKDSSQGEDALAYLSPEQTGRINRSIDYRSDLYSLGVILYEMLTGQLPFTATDPMELVHCHVARRPIPLCEIDSDIPMIVSDIVMKLLRKNAEERYQTALGAKEDLQKCQEHLAKNQDIKELTFELGQSDFTGQLQIPQKIYGRENEISMLLQAFNRVRLGKSELMLVSGYSGIGKTMLVNEVKKTIVEKRGYFISGKFDQYTRNVPYSAIGMAFQSLIQQVLTEKEEQVRHWKARLSEALGPNAQVLIDPIPELELLIGVQPTLEPLGPTEGKNRFRMVFQRFVQEFAREEHPLVIFLDDLQWIDAASLELLRGMMVEPESCYLLIIGAYRDNELPPEHPLLHEINRIKKEKNNVFRLTLGPLEENHLNHLLSDTFRAEKSQVRPLCQLLLVKTAGNPFFINQFLRNLDELKLLRFDVEQLKWSWDMDVILSQDITENVVDLLVRRLRLLPESLQRVLQLASCIGSQFDLRTLSTISERNSAELLGDLAEINILGFILPLDWTYNRRSEERDRKTLGYAFKFQHDRIQQAAYFLVAGKQNKRVHVALGRGLLKNFSQREIADNIFHIVKHLNLSADLLTDDEKLQLAEFNLSAALKAKGSTAYESSLQFLTQAMDLLSDSSWQERYELTYDIYRETAEVEYILSNFEQSESLVRIIIAHANTAVEKAQTYNLLVLQYTLQAQYEKAIQAARDALEFLGVQMPEDGDLHEAYQRECESLSRKLAGRSIESLVEQDRTPPADIRTALILMAKLIPTAFIFNVELLLWLGAKGIDLSLKFGWAVESSMLCPAYAFYPIRAFQDYQTAYSYSRLGILIAEKFQSKAELCRSQESANSHFNIWVSPLRLSNDLAAESIHAGLESGDIQFVSYAMLWQSCNNYFQGMTLPDFVQELQHFSHFVHKAKDQLSIAVVLAETFALVDMLGLEDNTWLPVSIDKVNEEQYVLDCLKNEAFLPLCLYYTFKLQTSYVLNDYRKANEFATQAEELLGHIFLAISVAEHNFYSSLTLAALYPEASKEEQRTYRQQLGSNQEQMKIWIENCPENFLNMYLLVEAEIARIEGDDLKAMDLYDQAIASAQQEGFIQNEAIANELCAEFWLGKEKEDFSKLYMVRAHHRYHQWGAKKKAKALEEEYPQFLSNPEYDSLRTVSPGNGLDLNTIIKAYHAISSEIDLESLLSRIMAIMVENAGAQKGVLLLKQENELFIEAVASGPDDIEMIPSQPIKNCKELPETIARYVFRTGKHVILNDAQADGKFSMDTYVLENQPKSILCLPICQHNTISRVLYLENSLAKKVFTEERILLLNLLLSQVVISLENVGLFEDQRKAHDALLESEERFKAIYENAPVLINAFDIDGRCVLWNNECQKTFGWTIDEIRAHGDALSLFYPDPVTRDEVIRTVTTDPDAHFREWHPVTKDGNTLDTMWANFRLPDGLTFNLGYDITEQRKTEERLRQSEKMNAIGQLAGGIAHDFNNQLSGVLGYADMLVNRLEDKQLSKYAVNIRKGAERAAELTAQLLAFSRKGKNLAIDVNIHKVISEVTDILEHSIDKRIKMHQIICEYDLQCPCNVRISFKILYSSSNRQGT